MQHLPLFWVKFDLTQLVLKTLSQSADAIDKKDRSSVGMPPANTQPRKPNNSLFNGSTLWYGFWCIGQSSARTPQRCSTFPASTTFIRTNSAWDTAGWVEQKQRWRYERETGGRDGWKWWIKRRKRDLKQYLLWKKIHIRLLLACVVPSHSQAQ